MAKESKTESELGEMILAEARKHPKCSAVEGIAITRTVKNNWDVAVIRHGANRDERCQEKLNQYVGELMLKYDLA